MSKTKNSLTLAAGIMLFLISYNFDAPISLFFKNIKIQAIDAILSIITNFGIVILVMLLIPSFILYKKNKKIIYLMIMDFIVSFILAFFIKLIVLRQRPIEAFTYPFTGIINYSFPSMHAMIAFSLLPILIESLPKQRIFWIIFAVLASFSRIYFNFHFMSDVVFGAFAGYFIGSCLMGMYKKGYGKHK